MQIDRSRLGIVYEENVPVPMRDGTILRANVLRPDGDGRHPALVERTPYGKVENAPGRDRFVHAGYALVSQDLRGRYASDGQWVPFTVPHTGDAEDGYDTVEWAAAQPWCDGKVGAMGVSYGGWTSWMLARMRPPHLKAMAARSIPPELTDVDWQGSFRPARRINWWLTTIAPDLRRRQGLPPPHTAAEARRIWNEIEGTQWLGLHPWSKIVRHLPPGLAEYADDWLQHPDCRPWRLDEFYADIDVPNLDTSGWYDHCNGSIRHLAGMQSHGGSASARTGSRLIIGPWNHMGLGRRTQGNLDFGTPAEVDVAALLIRWFDYWIKEKDNGVGNEPAVRYFLMGGDEWRSAPMWPPPATLNREWFLGPGEEAAHHTRTGALAPHPPQVPASDEYLYDPDNPVPTIWGQGLFTEPVDRQCLDYRADILRYVSQPLEQAVDVVGEPEVRLHAASSAPDTDFFVSLVDEAPEGPALEVSSGMIRARHRNGLDREDPLVPGTVTEFSVRLGPTACRFKTGHRIRLEVTSSDFPNYDRNHNTGRNDLVDPEMQIAHQAVYRGGEQLSRLRLPVLPETGRHAASCGST